MDSKSKHNVQLEVKIPFCESIMVEAEAAESIQDVKDKIGTMCKLFKDTFTLTFDGEEIGGDTDCRLVRELPFEDCSTLQVAYDDQYTARKELRAAMGSRYFSDIQGFCDRRDHDLAVCEIVPLLEKAGWLRKHIAKILICANRNGHEATLDLLMSYYADTLNSSHLQHETGISTSLLHLCDRFDTTSNPHLHASLFELLARHGANVKLANGSGRTALHMLVGNGTSNTNAKLCCAIRLLELGADANVADKNGSTPLHDVFQAEVELDDFAKYLLRNGHITRIGVAMKDKKGRTPLHTAAGSLFSLETIDILLQHKADIYGTDRRGARPLHYLMGSAVDLRVFRTAVVRLLGGDGINVEDNKGQTPLHHAALCTRDDAGERVQFLLKLGASVMARDNEGRTPLHLVKRPCVEKLLMNEKSKIVDICDAFLKHKPVRKKAVDPHTPHCSKVAKPAKSRQAAKHPSWK